MRRGTMVGMSTTGIFIFDEIFNSMVNDAQLQELQAGQATVHIIDKKCSIRDVLQQEAPDVQKIVCINPDFVDWHFGAQECADIAGLRTIISSSDNISWLDTAFADDHGIRYVALEHLVSEYAAVAEYAIMIMMNLARNVPLLMKNQFPLDYAQDFVTYQGLDIAGKTAGIIGLGNIGCAIAKLCSGLGMRVTYWSRTEHVDSGYAYQDIDTILSEADVVFPTLKPNSETKQLLPNERLARLKRQAIVVSVVSDLVDADYLVHRVGEKQLFGFGFGADPGVFSDYPGNVWAVPDYAWATHRNMHASYEQFIEKILQASRALA